MNTAKSTTNDSERGDIEGLLPWHAAGTLDYREAQSVEAALASDPELARRYELVREELAQTIHLNESLGAPSARAMDALFAKIDAEPARHAAASFNLGAHRARIFRQPFAAHSGLVGERGGAGHRAASGGDRRHRDQGSRARRL